MTRGLVCGVVIGLALSGCGNEGSATMRPGEDCLSCHSSGQDAFTLAGTVFGDASAAASSGLSGVTVAITDKNGTKVTLTSNAAGNFYTSQALAFPVSVQVQSGTAVAQMHSPAERGGCNGCHAASSSLGRIHVR
jgi:phosphatidate phosphatase APP1